MASLLKMVSPQGGDPLRDLLARAGEFRSVFQPVISLTEGKAIGFEGLLRLPEDLALNDPGAAFGAATGTPWLLDLELAALDTHLAAVDDLPEGRLFLNLTPTALLDPRFRADEMARRIRRCRLSPEQVVIEISELENVRDPEGFASAIKPLRDLHFQIAIDDFGAGFANVRLLVDIGPEFLKIDRALVTGACRHPRKRAFLETISHLGQRVNCAVIAEGVETEEDLTTVRACGIRVVQGYFTGPPQPAQDVVSISPTCMSGFALLDSPAETIGALAYPREGVGFETRIGDLIPLFERQPEPAAIPVLDGSLVLGLVTLNVLFLQLAHSSGHALWSERPVTEFVRTHNEAFDRLPALATLEQAAEVVRRRPAYRRFDPLVIENEAGGYHGLLPVDRLLAEMTRLKVDCAIQMLSAVAVG